MRRYLLAVPLLLVSTAAAAFADDKEEIRKLIPAATAMRKADFEKLATSPTTPKPSDVEDKSFTLQVFAMKLDDDRTENQREEFKFLTDRPRPSDWAKEVNRQARLGNLRLPLGPVTAVHLDRIEEITCNVDGDTARGTVSFQVPRLYQGKFQYVAKRDDDQWQITELAMPAHDVHLVRGDDGLWDKK